MAAAENSYVVGGRVVTVLLTNNRNDELNMLARGMTGPTITFNKGCHVVSFPLDGYVGSNVSAMNMLARCRPLQLGARVKVNVP